MFSRALSLTNLAKTVSPRHGGTTFALTNDAFHALGPRVNAFLFSPQGAGCLRGLMQYHLVANRTLYSDALYEEHGKVDNFYSGHGKKRFSSVHVELPTMFKGQKVNVDVVRRGYGTELRVNGFYRVMAVDVLASDGVMHVLDEMIFPPRRVDGKVEGKILQESVTVEMLKERFGGCAGLDSRMEL